MKIAVQMDHISTLHIEGDHFRLVADFINASTGQNYWSRVYTGQVSKLLAAQSDATRKLADHVGYSILKSSVELSRSRPLPQVESHETAQQQVDEQAMPQVGAYLLLVFFTYSSSGEWGEGVGNANPKHEH